MLNGKGTDVEPYIITSGKDLDEIRKDLTAYYQLDRSIDLTEVCNESDGTGWTPIVGFSGTLNGNGFMIRNLFINRDADNQALFGTTRGATIMNIGLIDINITGNGNNASAFIGNMTSYDDILQNCFATGNIIAPTGCSGLVGKMNGGLIKNCYSEVNIQTTNSASSSAAGFVYETQTKECRIEKCYYNGTITGATEQHPYVFKDSSGNAQYLTADCDNRFNVEKNPQAATIFGAYDNAGMINPSNFTSWQNEYYNFDKHIWVQVTNDTPRLYFEATTKYLIAITKDSKTEFYTFQRVNNQQGDWTKLTDSDISGDFPTAENFENKGITENQLTSISRFEWNKLRELCDEFELIASTDKYTINRNIASEKMQVEKELTDAIVLSTEIDFNKYGDSINQIKIVQ